MEKNELTFRYCFNCRKETATGVCMCDALATVRQPSSYSNDVGELGGTSFITTIFSSHFASFVCFCFVTLSASQNTVCIANGTHSHTVFLMRCGRLAIHLTLFFMCFFLSSSSSFLIILLSFERRTL